MCPPISHESCVSCGREQRANPTRWSRGYAPFIAAQMYYSLVGRDLEHEVVPFSQDAGVGMVVWSPLASGFLSGRLSSWQRRSTKRKQMHCSQAHAASPCLAIKDTFCSGVVNSSFDPSSMVPALTAAAMDAGSPILLSSSMASVTSLAKSAGLPLPSNAVTHLFGINAA